MTNVFLKGKNIVLRGLTPSDIQGPYAHWLNDPEVCEFNSHGRFPFSVEHLRSYVAETTQSKNQLVLAIVVKEDDRHIGNISLQSINWIDQSAEYAILLGDKSAWGKGYAKEASDLLLAHGFSQLNLHRIHCGTSSENMAMQKLAAYMGMKEEGRRREAHFKQGKFHDILEYGILRGEYEAKQK